MDQYSILYRPIFIFLWNNKPIFYSRGILLAIVTGCLFGMKFSPIIYTQDHPVLYPGSSKKGRWDIQLYKISVHVQEMEHAFLSRSFVTKFSHFGHVKWRIIWLKYEDKLHIREGSFFENSKLTKKIHQIYSVSNDFMCNKTTTDLWF